MSLDLELLSPEELKQGFRFDAQAGSYRCIFCGESFGQGEIFSIGGKLFEAFRAVREHLRREHPDQFTALLQAGEKYVTLTHHQQKLMGQLLSGSSDREIAGESGVSASTVRRQRFTFREKAKQAKLYLALYELAAEGSREVADQLLPVPPTASMPDERFDVTVGEQEKILLNAFDSLAPLHLRHLPVREKKKVVILGRIVQEFEPGRTYEEKEVNTLLKTIDPDFATLRRYLIEYGFLERTQDCASYWRKE